MPDTSNPLLIYGATGYSGRLITVAALARGLRPLLAGRDAARLATTAEAACLEHRVATLDDARGLDVLLRDVRAVIHTAGPFSSTSRPMVDACLRTGVHYLDITGEIPVIEALASRDAEARQRGIMIMPGVGFDVVPSDCLAAHLVRRIPSATRLAIGISGLAADVTRGSAKTLAETADYGVVRREGTITRVPLGSLERNFDYGEGPRASLNVSWGDVAAAYYSTGIPNIEVYAQDSALLRAVLMTCRYFGWLLRTAPWQVWLKAQADVLAPGPSDEVRATRRTIIVAEVEDHRGRRATSRLHGPEAYTFTSATASAIAERVLAGDVEVGFQTPSRIYGSDFPLQFPGVSREDLE